jgi:hypothetical protein
VRESKNGQRDRLRVERKRERERESDNEKEKEKESEREREKICTGRSRWQIGINAAKTLQHAATHCNTLQHIARQCCMIKTADWCIECLVCSRMIIAFAESSDWQNFTKVSLLTN